MNARPLTAGVLALSLAKDEYLACMEPILRVGRRRKQTVLAVLFEYDSKNLEQAADGPWFPTDGLSSLADELVRLAGSPRSCINQARPELVKPYSLPDLRG